MSAEPFSTTSAAPGLHEDLPVAEPRLGGRGDLEALGDNHRQSNRLRALAESGAAVVWYTGPDGSVIAPNPSWEAFTGQRPKQYFGWGWLAAIHPADAPALARAVRRDVVSRKPASATYRLRRADGEFRLMQARVAPVMSGATIEEWVGVSVDITEDEVSQTLLKNSEFRGTLLADLWTVCRLASNPRDVYAAALHKVRTHFGADHAALLSVRQSQCVESSEDNLPRFAGRPAAAIARLSAGWNCAAPLVVPDTHQWHPSLDLPAVVRSIIAAPLLSDGAVVAMWCMTCRTPREWQVHEVRVLEEAARRVWMECEGLVPAKRV